MKKAFLIFLLTGLASLVSAGSTESTFLRIRNQYGSVEATLHAPNPRGEIAIVQAHPWGDSLGSFPEAALAEKGIAVLSLNTRAVNKDDLAPDEIFETLLLDVAAGVEEMKERGYEKIVLMGGSAGGPLMSLYQNAAENGNAAFAGERKLYKFPGFFEKGGSPMRLPKADGLIFRNPIDGTASSFLNRLDPSVVDEATGKRDASLDMYNPANGYDPKTATANYSKEFIERYGQAQAARMNRLIDAAQKRLGAMSGKQISDRDSGYLIITRTRARLLYTDMHLGDGAQPHQVLPGNKQEVPKHDRVPGHYSLFGETPERNDAIQGTTSHQLTSFLSARAVRARFVNPMATTLKDWGVDIESTNNTTVGNMMHVAAPWLLFSGTADDKINTAELIYHEAAAKDKKIIVLRGATHGITSVDPKRFLSTEALRGLMVDEMVKWINERFR